MTSDRRRQPLPIAARVLDARLDRALRALDEALALEARTLGPDTEQGHRAIELRQEVFPRGPATLTSLSCVSQHELVSVLVTRLRDPADLEPAVEALGLTRFVDRVAALNRRRAASRPRAPQATN